MHSDVKETKDGVREIASLMMGKRPRQPGESTTDRRVTLRNQKALIHNEMEQMKLEDANTKDQKATEKQAEKDKRAAAKEQRDNQWQAFAEMFFEATGKMPSRSAPKNSPSEFLDHLAAQSAAESEDAAVQHMMDASSGAPCGSSAPAAAIQQQAAVLAAVAETPKRSRKAPEPAAPRAKKARKTPEPPIELTEKPCEEASEPASKTPETPCEEAPQSAPKPQKAPKTAGPLATMLSRRGGKVIECPLARAAKSDLDSRSQLKSFLNITPSSALAPEAVIDNTADKDPVTPEVPADIMIDGTDKDSTTPVVPEAVIQAEIEPAPSSVVPVLPTTAPSTGTIDKQAFEEADNETRIKMICAACRATTPVSGYVDIMEPNEWLKDWRALNCKAFVIMQAENVKMLF